MRLVRALLRSWRERTLYVDNLSYKTSSKELMDHFNKYDTIVYADVFMRNLTGIHSGRAKVAFRSKEGVIDALNEKVHIIDDRKVIVKCLGEDPTQVRIDEFLRNEPGEDVPITEATTGTEATMGTEASTSTEASTGSEASMGTSTITDSIESNIEQEKQI